MEGRTQATWGEIRVGKAKVKKGNNEQEISNSVVALVGATHRNTCYHF